MSKSVTGMRKFGIDIVGDVPWGTHLVQFYQTKEDLKNILVPYFAEGLRNNEYCMWITSLPLEVKEAEKALEQAVPDLASFLKKGQIEILPHTQWYVINGKFEAEKVLDGWAQKENSARALGFDGLRLSGNTFWIKRKEWKSFVEYETKINDFIGLRRMLALCTYSLKKCTGTDVVDVVRNHAGTLIRKGETWHLMEDVAKRKRVENALAQSESRYRSLFANMKSGIGYHKMMFDENGKPVDYVFLDVNDAFGTITGLEREQIIGKRVTDVFRGGGKALDGLIDAYGKVTATGEAADFDFYFAPLQKWFQIAAYSPEKGCFATVFADITRQRKMEDELKSLARFPFENPQAVLRSDSRGMILYCNPQCQRSLSRLIGKVGQSLPTHWRQYVDDALSSNKRLVFEELVDGRTFSLEIVPILSENYANIYGIDITDRKIAEQALRDSEERFRAIAQMTPIQISVSRASDGTILFTNPAYNRAFGFAEGELVGRKAPDLYCNLADRIALIDALKRQGFVQNYETKVKRTDGTSFWVSASVCNISFSGEPALLGASLDITERKQTESALRESQRDLNRAQTVAKTGSWRLDVKHNTLRWSDETYRIFGIPNGTDLTYETFLYAVHPDDREYVDQKWKAALAGEAYEIEHRITIGKEIKWVHETAEMEFSDDGTITGGFGTVSDITQFKEMQTKLEEYSENLEKLVEERTKRLELSSSYARSLIEASLDPLVTISVEGKITDVNRATELATGYAREQLIGSDFSNYFTEPEKARAGYQHVFANGFVRDYPLAIRHRSGKTIEVVYNATVYRSDKGDVQGVFAAARDVTERKMAEERYRMLFESIDEGFCVVEMVFDSELRPIDYRFMEVNASFERQTGMHDAEGKLMRSFAPDHEAYWFEIYGEIALTGKPKRFTSEARALGRWYDVYAFPVGEGTIRRVGILFNDITERRNLEKQLQDNERMAAIGATAAMVGHDIRNPLQSIVGNVDLLTMNVESIPESTMKDEMLESLKDLEKQVDYINKIIMDLQDFTKPLKPILEDVDLQITIDDLLLHQEMPSNIKAQICIDQGTRRVTSDPSHLKRVLGNLISNAVQAMPEGGKLTVHAYQESGDAVITIEDTGRGIPEENRDKMFKPLFTTKSKGQGFGLAVAKRLTEALDGTITYESQEGKGTKFIIRLPQKKTEQSLK